jgi:hypothetical protein
MDASAAGALELSRITSDGSPTAWSAPMFKLFRVGPNEVLAVYRLHFFRVTDKGAAYEPALSKGLPIQTDLCVAPSIDELRRDAGGELIVTLADGGPPHFTGGCRDRVSTGEAYAFRADRWVPTTTPRWAEGTRHVYQELTISGRVMRLMGPLAAPAEDGWSPPSAFDALSRCFGQERPSLETWDSPPSLPELPKDLCSERIAVAPSGRTLLVAGRTRDGKFWLERRRTDGTVTRARLPSPGCKIVAHPRYQGLESTERGTLTVMFDCSGGGNEPGDWSEAMATVTYDASGPELVVQPTAVTAPARQDSLSTPVAVQLANGVWVRAASGVLSVEGLGGHLVRSKILDAESQPLGPMLSWKPRFEAQCPPHSLTILAKVPADDAARQDSTRKSIGALAAKHPEIRAQAIASFRIDDTQYFAQRWRETDERRDANLEKWSKQSGLLFDRRCLPRLPDDATSFTVDANGEISTLPTYTDPPPTL